MNTVLVVVTRSTMYLLKYSSGSAPPSKFTITLRLKPDAIFCASVGLGSKSPASCSTVKLIEFLIVIKRLNHPLAPLPHVAVIVDVIAIRVGIPETDPATAAPSARHSEADASSRSTTFSYAFGDSSAKKHVDLRQRRRQTGQSNVTRRRIVALSASADGLSPSASRRAKIKRSISLRHHFEFLTFGTAGRTGGTNDQCSCHCAPCPTHRLINSICAGVSVLPVLAGGM